MAVKPAIDGGSKVRREPFGFVQDKLRRPLGMLRASLPCPVAERPAAELFTLLVHPTLTTADLDDVVKAVGKVVNRYESG